MTLQEVRQLSKALFGNVDRLQAAAAIGRLAGKPVTASLIAAESGLGLNRAQEQIDKFRSAGVLVPEFDSAKRSKEHRAVDIAYWDLAATLLEQLRDLDLG